MAAIFAPAANTAMKGAIVVAAAVLLAGAGWWWLWPRTDYVRDVGFTPQQPVPFSHEHHVAGLGIDCRFCHTGVEVAADAGLPPTHTCMTCHSQIWTNAALLAPVRQSYARNTPIVWHRVNNLPDYVYFNHSIHIAKGVGCSSCHGAVDRMPLTTKAATLTMQFCLNCHRDPGAQIRPRDAIFDTEYRRGPATPPPAMLLADYKIGGRDITACSTCHR